MLEFITIFPFDIFKMQRFFLFFTLLFTAFAGQAGLFDNNKPRFLTADEAFIFDSEVKGDQLALHWQIAEGYYLYKKEIQLVSTDMAFGELEFPVAESYDDEFFGKVDIYRHELSLTVPIQQDNTLSAVDVTYQGCTKGFCYPPETKRIQVDKGALEKTQKKSPALLAEKPLQNQLAEGLAQNLYTIFGFFLLGLGLAFTPCVLPMLPLLSAIVIGSQQRANTLRALALSLSYVQGMALTYTLLGLVVASVGLQFQIALQSPVVLICLSVLFVGLALSMFGLYELRLPNAWQNKLTQYSQQQKSGAFFGVFVMGVLAGLVASPCTSAPLSAALLYVAQSGDLLVGGLALYLLALGMGLPLIAITLFGNKVLPKSGAWLEKVKMAFGFVMLAMPIFLLSRVLPADWELPLWSLLATAFLLWFAFVQSVNLLKIIFILLAFLTAYPTQQLLWQSLNPRLIEKRAGENTQVFQSVSRIDELHQILQKTDDRLIMLDLYADWCVACKEFERDVFSQEKVQQAFANMQLLRVDLTKNSVENQFVMQELQVQGLPTILFFDSNGKEIPNSRITGFLNAEQFLNKISQLKQ